MAALANQPEAAQQLGIKSGTLWKWREKEGCPAVKVGHRYEYDVDAVRAWRNSENRRAFLREGEPAPLVAVDVEALARAAARWYREAGQASGFTSRQAASAAIDGWCYAVRELTGHPPAPPFPADIATLIAVARDLPQ